MESFFQNGSSLDLIEVEELLLYRYNNIEYIMNLNINEGIQLINKAIEKRDEEKCFSMWVAQLPFMTKDDYVSFSDYQLQLTGKGISTESKEEALAKAEEIEIKARMKRGEIDGIGNF